jgi:hypothetical protein
MSKKNTADADVPLCALGMRKVNGEWEGYYFEVPVEYIENPELLEVSERNHVMMKVKVEFIKRLFNPSFWEKKYRDPKTASDSTIQD